jgi:hypothetical protein
MTTATDWYTTLGLANADAARNWDRYRANLALVVEESRDLDRAETLLATIDAGRWARWFVRGALDPAYALPEDRDEAVRALCRRRRARDAATLIEGWVRR